MKDKAPISTGIIAIAAVLGIIAAGMALFLFDSHWFWALIIGVIVAVIVAILLLLGWREPQAEPLGVAPSGSATADPEPEVSTPAAPVAADPEPEVSVKPEPEPVAAPEPEVAATTEPEPAPAPKPVPEVAKDPAPESVPAVEPATETQPEFLSAAREGGPDDLKQIKGVGKKLEETLHGMGIFHFDQIAEWGPAEQAWIDDNLKGFKGRATRDNWVEQAKVLAAGGTTAFSSKVKEGNVY